MTGSSKETLLAEVRGSFRRSPLELHRLQCSGFAMIAPEWRFVASRILAIKNTAPIAWNQRPSQSVPSIGTITALMHVIEFILDLVVDLLVTETLESLGKTVWEFVQRNWRAMQKRAEVARGSEVFNS